MLSLSLEKTPAAEDIAATGLMWCKALMALPVGWDEKLDAPRIREAFRKLLPTVDRWPVPKQLIEQLPARPEHKALPEPRMAPEETKKRIKELLRVVSGGA